jgi:hypothetical protein
MEFKILKELEKDFILEIRNGENFIKILVPKEGIDWNNDMEYGLNLVFMKGHYE